MNFLRGEQMSPHGAQPAHMSISIGCMLWQLLLSPLNLIPRSHHMLQPFDASQPIGVLKGRRCAAVCCVQLRLDPAGAVTVYCS